MHQHAVYFTEQIANGIGLGGRVGGVMRINSDLSAIGFAVGLGAIDIQGAGCTGGARAIVITSQITEERVFGRDCVGQ